MRRGEIIGRPDGWQPDGELDHFEVCPGCGSLVDCRDLAQVLYHIHGAEVPLVFFTIRYIGSLTAQRSLDLPAIIGVIANAVVPTIENCVCHSSSQDSIHQAQSVCDETHAPVLLKKRES